MSLLDEESVKVIGAVAVLTLAVFLLFKLFSPVFDVAGETSESYFGTLEKAVEDIPSSFYMMDNGNDDLNFYLVYFGEVFSFERDDKNFARKADDKKFALCVCSESESFIICGNCMDMKMPVAFYNRVTKQYSVPPWVVGEDVRIKLQRSEVNYAFSSE
ncbi:MAG: hypothetical protein V1888_01550 [archaeon]